MQLFGFEIKKKTDDKEESFVAKENTEGATVVSAGGSYGTYVELNNQSSNEADLIQKYREMAQMPEVDSAVDEIVNEFVDIEDPEVVSIDISEKLDISIRNKLIEEFKESLRLLDFKQSCYDICRRWYIDGRLKYHIILDKSKATEGIKEVRYVDPRKLKKIREIKNVRIGSQTPEINSDFTTQKIVNEYYIFNEKGFGNLKTNNSSLNVQNSNIGLRISTDSIIDIPSGLNDINNNIVLSYLNKAIKPLNQLRTLEDASLIYTLARAPQRRVWYIDTADLPPAKAKQHFNDMVNLHKNKLVFNSDTGEIRDDRKFITMLEDIWLPRRGDIQRGTEVTTLPGSDTMNDMTQVEYFQKNLYRSLNIPVGRLQEGEVFGIGRSSQITRDEVKFSKFIARLRTKFSSLFVQIIKMNFIIKGLMTLEEWESIKGDISFKWASSSYWDELKEAEILNDRINSVNAIAPLIGQFVSKEFVKKRVLRLSEEEINELAEQMKKEAEEDIDLKNSINSSTNNSLDQDIPNNDQESSDNTDLSTEDKIHQAKVDYDKLKTKEKKTPDELSQFKSAAQILGKNKR